MVGSSFILINKNGRRTLLNIEQITAVSDQDILLTSAARRIYWEFPPEQEMAYIVRVEQAACVMNFMFIKKEERDELLDRLIEAVSPSTTIISAPGLLHTWPELARLVPVPKYVLDGKEYATRAEYEKARDELDHRETLQDMDAARRSHLAAQDSATPLTSKPPRKPTTRKPRK